MRLVATLGTTEAKYKHRYRIEKNRYDTLFSFEALKKHYQIPDSEIVIIGTRDTKLRQDEHIRRYQFVEVESDSLEHIFEIVTKTLKNGDIVDLTQSFRSISFGAMLSISFAKTLGKNPHDIFYAQTDDPSQNPAKGPCAFTFVSLQKYDEVADLARVINTFVATLFVLDVPINDSHFCSLYRDLDQLSRYIFDNNYKKAFFKAKQCKKEINGIREALILQEHIQRLEEEIDKILHLEKETESETLLEISAYLNSKEITLHAVTALYESMVAFLDEEVDSKECNEKKTRSGKMRQTDTYERRNCLKKESESHSARIPESAQFLHYLREVDKLRNISAHAFTSDTTEENINNKINKVVAFLRTCYRQRYSCQKGADRLKAVFGNR